ncbi:hypothetical protein EJB05_30526 [Eragrostis curvula]|uniref:Uncharacterized protein n=1 Tax=Eragrostis curvula TaxID=38414 RepID=A0A5J9UCM6_9POAL|nr:hypothetical protein EJB05_30526 [Eragrostis curvula]
MGDGAHHWRELVLDCGHAAPRFSLRLGRHWLRQLRRERQPALSFGSLSASAAVVKSEAGDGSKADEHEGSASWLFGD